MTRFTMTLVLPFLLAACDSVTEPKIELKGFAPLPRIDSLAGARVQPALPTDYWELRLAFAFPVNGDSTRIFIQSAGGTTPRSQLSPSIIAQLNALKPRGFHAADEGGWYFLAAVHGPDVRTFTSPAGVRAFLGTLDGVEEVMLLLFALDYDWSKPDTGIKSVSAGWEAVVYEWDGCNARDRVRLRVLRDGSIQELEREQRPEPTAIC